MQPSPSTATTYPLTTTLTTGRQPLGGSGQIGPDSEIRPRSAAESLVMTTNGKGLDTLLTHNPIRDKVSSPLRCLQSNEILVLSKAFSAIGNPHEFPNAAKCRGERHVAYSSIPSPDDLQVFPSESKDWARSLAWVYRKRKDLCNRRGWERLV
jgi:hypothetical protein